MIIIWVLRRLWPAWQAPVMPGRIESFPLSRHPEACQPWKLPTNGRAAHSNFAEEQPVIAGCNAAKLRAVKLACVVFNQR